MNKYNQLLIKYRTDTITLCEAKELINHMLTVYKVLKLRIRYKTLYNMYKNLQKGKDRTEIAELLLQINKQHKELVFKMLK
jgi:hypothetical protein